MLRLGIKIICAILLGLGIFLAVNLIVELFLSLKPPLGDHHDFLAFFGASHFVLHGQVDKIFDATTLSNFQLSIVPYKVGAAGYMPYLNPPFVAVLLSPLALFNYTFSRILWFGLNFLLIALIGFQLTKGFSTRKRVLGFILLICSFPVYQTLIEGQLSLIILAGCLAVLHFAKQERYLESGIFLSVLWIKPQLAAFVLLGLITFHYFKILWGMLATGAIIFLLTLPFAGLSLDFLYVSFSLNVFSAHFAGAGATIDTVWKGALYLTEGINGFFAALIGQKAVSLVNILTLMSGVTLSSIYILAGWKINPGFGKLEKELMLLASIALILLFDPHLYAQDVVLIYLFIPLLLSRFKNSFLVVVGVATAANIVLLDQFLPLHLFTIILASLTIYICLLVIKERNLAKSLLAKVIAS